MAAPALSGIPNRPNVLTAAKTFVTTGALPRTYRQLVVPNSSRLRVLKYSEKIVATFNLDVPPTPSETKGSNFSPFSRVARSGNDRPIKREHSFRFRSINKQIDCRVGL
ncbi:hypothetical protein AVEN_255681-1 [Araneus ventricosus]|uniref:Uncharacterized protein n=1 Tax=Araneus ventricosus TaxID=182803 RepID=A0A4Y2H119_ARAVE|nr:hypothetical protein AVEN_255681-1 [Araneus ventricosus]